MAQSAMPLHYYIIFAVYEPIITTVGFLGVLADPKKVRTCSAGGRASYSSWSIPFSSLAYSDAM